MREVHKCPKFAQYSRVLPGAERIHENILVAAPIAEPPCQTVKTMWDALRKAVALYPTADFLGELDAAAETYSFLSYEKGYELALCSGAACRALGISPGERVGLAGIHTVNYELAMWGLVSFGATLVPLYHNAKLDALREIVESCQLELIFCDNAARATQVLRQISQSHLKTVKTLVLLNDEEIENNNNDATGVTVMSFSELLKIGRENAVDPVPPKPDDIYIICHTSGTTGRPKGVQLSHRNLLAAMAGLYTQWCLPPHDFRFGPGDTYFSFLSLAHIYEHLMQAFMVYVGARVGIYSGDIKMLVLDIQKLQPTIISLVPRILNKLHDLIHANVAKAPFIKRSIFESAKKVKLAQLRKGVNNPNTLWDKLAFEKLRAIIGGRVRVLTTGGAPVTPAVHDFTRIAFGCPLFEGYGQTECGAAGTLNLPGDLTGGTHVGAPAPWAQVKLIDAPELGYFAGQDRGEVCFRGAAVMSGYFADEGLSRRTVDADGWLHTGDIGEWLPDGRLRIVDRKNALFKLCQGDFISAESIESVLVLSPLVTQIFVTGFTTRSFLVGVAVVDPAELRREISRSADFEAQTLLDVPETQLLQKEAIRRFVVQHLGTIGKAKGLQTIELIRRVFLTTEEFSAESGLLTPTLKIQRQICRQRFAAQIEEMYGQEEEL